MSEDPTLPKITDDEIKRPEFSWRPIEELVPYPNNTRDHTEEQIKILMYSLVHYGWKKFPAIEAKSNYIVAGHGIIEAARRLGLKKIPCTVSDDTDENHRGYRIMDNKSQEMSSWIDKTLNLELVELDSMGFNVGLTGFSDDELRERIEGYGGGGTGLTDEDEVPETPEVPETKIGDLYLLGKHRLLCGDSTKREDVDYLMNGNMADMVFTDPPYGLGGYGGRNGRTIKNDDLSGKDLIEFLKCIPEAKHRFVFCDKSTLPEFISALGRPDDLIVWKKPWPSMGRGYRGFYELIMFFGKFEAMDQFDFWEVNYRDEGMNSTIQARDMKIHPTQKPVRLAEKAIQNHHPSTVLDLFGGSGSTIIASEKTKSKCLMMEMDPRYCDVIVKRWEAFTGQKAERIESGA